jgi:hypothetical protein
MKNDTITIRCSVRKNLFKRLGDLAGLTYLEKYKFYKFFEMITNDKVDKYRQHKNLTYDEACCEYWLYIMFGWTEYDEEKYAELLEMPILDLYDKLSLAYKKYLEKEKLKRIKLDF